MSDQDFFFDDDEAAEKPEKPEPSRTPAKAPVRAPRASVPAATAAGQQSVTMTVAGLIGVVALLLGMIIGILIPTGGGSQVGSPAVSAPAGSNQAAPLSPEQLEGGMPPGHPDIGEMGGDEATPGMPGAEDPGADADASDAGSPDDADTPVDEVPELETE